MTHTAEEFEALIQFLYLAPVGLVQIAPDGQIILINPISAQLLMPLSRDGGLENLFTALEGVAPDLAHRAGAFAPDYGMVCEEMKIQIKAGVPGKSGAQVLSLSLLKLDRQRMMAVLRDVTQEIQRDLLLRQNEAWLNAILTGITDYAIARLDRDGRVDDWNESIGHLTGLDRDAVVGQPYSIFYPDDAITPERTADRLREAEASGWSMDECWRTRADGSRFWGSAIIAPLRHRTEPAGPVPLDDGAQGGPAFCLVIRDITEKRDASEKFRQAATCDHLTGIANRRAFFEAAELELERWRRAPRPLALILFDADNFKRINDTHGHPVGDAVLRHLATTLAGTFRQVDVVARVGGEEFAVLLPSTDLPSALAVAERVRRKIAATCVEVNGERIAYTVSGGVALMDAGMAGLDDLLKRADAALYGAKAAGRNCIESALAA
jgi:diguanylate cyclase (GGDEF)-like protein/PAS domain S-box-containing protein